MGVLDGFLATWTKARETYGQGTPPTGERFDQSGQFRSMQSTVETAAPGSKWSGGAASAYDKANTDHGRVFGDMANLDQRLGNKVTQSATIVQTGRQNLDAVRQWVMDAAANVPPGKNREQLLLPIVSQGLGRVQEIVTDSNGQMNGVAKDIQALKNEYQALGAGQKFKEGPADVQGAQGDEKDKKSEEDKKKDAIDKGGEDGEHDGESLSDGKLSPEETKRLHDATTLSPEQTAALDNGDVKIPPERMAYLNGLSHSMDGKTPSEIKTMLDNLSPDDRKAVSNALHLVGSDRIKTDVPDPSLKPGDHGYVPAEGGKDSLPKSIRDIFDAPLQNDPSGEWIDTPGGHIHIEPDYNKPYKFLDEYRDIAAISNCGDQNLQRSSALNEGMLAESRELLEHFESDKFPNWDNAWGHENLDPTLQDLITSASHDPVAVHDMVAGPDSVANDNFMHDLYRHDWADNGAAVGTMFPGITDHTERAGQTMHAFDAYAAGHYKEMLDMSGTDSLGQVNPELVRALGKANIPYIDDMAGFNMDGTRGFGAIDDGVNANNMRNLFAVIDSDDVAGREFNTNAANTWKGLVADYSKDLVESGVPNGELLQSVGKLQGAMDMGEYIHQLDSGKDEHAAAVAAWETEGQWYDSAHDLIGAVPGAKDALDVYDGIPGDPLKDFFVGEKPPVPDPGHPMGLRDMDKLSQSVAAYLVNEKYGDLGQLNRYVGENGQLDWANPGAQKWIDDYISRVHDNNDLPWLKYSDQYSASIYVAEGEYDWLKTR